MTKVFKVVPKRTIRRNCTVLTPEMEIIVTTKQSTSTPFYNGAQEVKAEFMRHYGFDYQKACCSVNDFDFTRLD